MPRRDRARHVGAAREIPANESSNAGSTTSRKTLSRISTYSSPRCATIRLDVDFSRYEVNAFVCNNPNEGAPSSARRTRYTTTSSAKVDYENRQGNLYTDFRRITPGAMHRANGGFLLLDADESLRQFMSWDVLKRVLRYREPR